GAPLSVGWAILGPASLAPVCSSGSSGRSSASCLLIKNGNGKATPSRFLYFPQRMKNPPFWDGGFSRLRRAQRIISACQAQRGTGRELRCPADRDCRGLSPTH